MSAPRSPPPPQRRDPVAKALRRLRGGPHRTGPSRADLKQELRRLIECDEAPKRSG